MPFNPLKSNQILVHGVSGDMSPVRFLTANVLVLGLGWQAGLSSADSPLASASPAPRQSDAASLRAPAQTISIEPIDNAHVRLRLEGREKWIVDSAGFTLVPTLDGPPGGSVRVIAKPGNNTVFALGASQRAEAFELAISPISGVVHFEMNHSRRK